jgi:hypothetical protein
MIEFSLSSISVARMLATGERGQLNVPFNRYEGYGKTTPEAAIVCIGRIIPNVAKAGGLQSQGDKGAAVVDLLQALGNAGSCVLRLSRRGKKMA